MKAKPLNRDDVRDVLLGTLRDFLGPQAPDQLSETTDPIKDLGLDSEDGVEFACVLSEKFGCLVPNDVNPFVNDAQNCSRRIGETVDMMCSLIEREHAHE